MRTKLVCNEDEVGLHLGLAVSRVELGDERAVAGRADAHVHVRRPAGIAARDARLVAIAALGARALGRALRAVVPAPGVRGPPPEPRAAPAPAAPRRTDGAAHHHA